MASTVPRAGHQFTGTSLIALRPPPRGDLLNADLPRRLLTLYSSTIRYCPQLFALLNENSLTIRGDARSIVGPDTCYGLADDIERRELVARYVGGVLVLEGQVKARDKGVEGSRSFETRFRIYLVPSLPLVIYDVEFVNLGPPLRGLAPGIRSCIEKPLAGALTSEERLVLWLSREGELALEETPVEPVVREGFYGVALGYYSRVKDQPYPRLVQGFFVLYHSGGVPAFRVGHVELNLAFRGARIRPGGKFRYVVAEVVGVDARVDAPRLAKLARYVWRLIEERGVEEVAECFAAASPMVEVSYGEGAYPVHAVRGWTYDAYEMRGEVTIACPAGRRVVLKIYVPKRLELAEVGSTAVDYSFRLRGEFVEVFLNRHGEVERVWFKLRTSQEGLYARLILAITLALALAIAYVAGGRLRGLSA